jgi:hypothetical protein
MRLEDLRLDPPRAGEVLVRVQAAGVCRCCRQARVRFHTTRTQPNVRFSTLACAWSGYARHLYAVLTTRNLIRLDPNL